MTTRQYRWSADTPFGVVDVAIEKTPTILSIRLVSPFFTQTVNVDRQAVAAEVKRLAEWISA